MHCTVSLSDHGVWDALYCKSVRSRGVHTNRIRCQAPSGHPTDDNDMPPSSSRSMVVVVCQCQPICLKEYWIFSYTLKYQLLHSITFSTCINFWRNKESMRVQIRTLAFWLHWIITPASPHIERNSRSKLRSPDRASRFPFQDFLIITLCCPGLLGCLFSFSFGRSKWWSLDCVFECLSLKVGWISFTEFAKTSGSVWRSTTMSQDMSHHKRVIITGVGTVD